jgi:NAD(P)-dependent dehydrogenase (short-subunit alcohol dehydrogenase family)
MKGKFEKEVPAQKHFLVTGGTSGIGLSIVRLLGNVKGNVVFSISRSKKGIDAATKVTAGLPGTIRFLRGDVSSTKSIAVCIRKIATQTDRLDGLVNNAGVIRPGKIEELSTADWNTTIDTNLAATFAVVKHCLPMLKRSSRASIVNVSSISSTLLNTSVAYCASKVALDMLTRGLSRELAKYGIRVNSVNPGVVRTGFQIRNGLMNASKYQSFLKRISRAHPLGLGEPEDVANVILFLLSDYSRWMTGNLLVVDGGRVVTSQ